MLKTIMVLFLISLFAISGCNFGENSSFSLESNKWMLDAYQGDKEAMIVWGRMNIVGYDRPKNLIEAYAWLTIAGDPEGLLLRENIMKEMTPDDIEKGEIRILTIKRKCHIPFETEMQKE